MKNLMTEDLERSGLTPQDATKLKMKYLEPEETKKLTGINSPAFQIPYFGLDKKVRKFYRLRFLSDVKQKRGFGKSKEDSKSQRYYQPKNTIPCFYLPPSVQWEKVSKDTAQRIYITEGEKKAAKACKEGLATIGLGGVWSWKSKKFSVPVIEDFEEFTWAEREVVMTFDSDVSSNPKVVQALNSLSRELLNRGAKVLVKRLPVDDDKIGLDDYLKAHSKKAFLALREDPYKDGAELYALNEELAYIESMGSVYVIEHAMLYRNKPQLVSVAFADRIYTVNDGDKMRPVNAVEEWLKWRHRRRHKSLAYEPGEPQILPDGSLNMWSGWGTDPEEGDLKPWNDLLDHLFNGEDEFRAWFLQWLAYPIQNPGTKLMSAVLLISLEEGTGKSFLGYILGDIYGQDNFSVVQQDDLHSSYNSWCVNKQFIMGEEITGSDSRRDADRIKNMLTREQMQVSIKYQPGYQLKDCANYLFTSNRPDAMFLDRTDRRIAVHEVRNKKQTDAFYARIDKWRRSGGSAALHQYLLNEVDVSKFNPRAPAYSSRSKIEMVELSKSDLDMTAEMLTFAPDDILHVNGKPVKRDLYTLEELLLFTDPDGNKRTTKIALSKALRRAGFRVYTVRTNDGVKKLWALRNVKAWDESAPNELAAHYEGFVVKLDGKRNQKFADKG